VRRAAGALAAAVVLVALGCGREEAPAPGAGGGGGSPSAGASAPPPGDAQRGRQVWLGQCVACHNADPAVDGPVGPAVKGASRELLEARVVRGVYPPGYRPKRDSRVMPPRPDLAPNVADLAAFLR
jgi:mono/diheme cytochrome c family protein